MHFCTTMYTLLRNNLPQYRLLRKIHKVHFNSSCWTVGVTLLSLIRFSSELYFCVNLRLRHVAFLCKITQYSFTAVGEKKIIFDELSEFLQYLKDRIICFKFWVRNLLNPVPNASCKDTAFLKNTVYVANVQMTKINATRLGKRDH
jgi:hypothetical protein